MKKVIQLVIISVLFLVSFAYAGPVEEARKLNEEEKQKMRVMKAQTMLEAIASVQADVNKGQEALVAARACLTKMETGDFTCYAESMKGLNSLTKE